MNGLLYTRSEKNSKTPDYQILTKLMRLKQEQILEFMYKFLIKNGYKEIIFNKEYIIAYGDIPVALLAHADTVFKSPPMDFFYDRVNEVLWSPQGMGADDRAGIFAITKIVNAGYHPHIIITTDEECGGIGACAIAEDMPNFAPEHQLCFMIQLDRQGKEDSVYYECDNKDFEKYINSFGFVTAEGTFTDISIIAPEWKVAAVNLSIGYVREHTFTETLYVESMYATIDKVKKLLSAESFTKFDYIPMVDMYRGWKFEDYFEDDKCDLCGEHTAIFMPIFSQNHADKPCYQICPDCYNYFAKYNDIIVCKKCGKIYLKLPGMDGKEWECESCKHIAQGTSCKQM